MLGVAVIPVDAFDSNLSSSLQIRNMVVQVLFSITFALSCTMFELIIFEIIGIMDLG